MHPIFEQALKGFIPGELPKPAPQTKPLLQTYFSFKTETASKPLVNLADAYAKENHVSCFEFWCLKCGYTQFSNERYADPCPKCGNKTFQTFFDEDPKPEEREE